MTKNNFEFNTFTYTLYTFINILKLYNYIYFYFNSTEAMKYNFLYSTLIGTFSICHRRTIVQN